MFDDLRKASDEAEPVQEVFESPFETYDEGPPETLIMGMTAVQRFVLSLLLFGTVVILGLTCLMVTQRLWLF